jgi:hypothetical protein
MDPADRLNGSSMPRAILVTLVAYRLQRLRQRIRRDVTSLSQHLKPKLEEWMQAPGQSVSPSVEPSLTADHQGG